MVDLRAPKHAYQHGLFLLLWCFTHEAALSRLHLCGMNARHGGGAQARVLHFHLSFTNTQERQMGKLAVGADMLAGCSERRNTSSSQSLSSQCFHKQQAGCTGNQELQHSVHGVLTSVRIEAWSPSVNVLFMQKCYTAKPPEEGRVLVVQDMLCWKEV